MKDRILLIQPTMGISGEYVRHIPLSLLYVASGLVKSGFRVTILDNRIHSDRWRKAVLEELDDSVLCVGLTVMSGSPIANSIEVSKMIKERGAIPVVWGGAHPTARPGQILEKEYIDYTVSGSGVSSTVKLAEFLREGVSLARELEGIPGLGYRKEGCICLNDPYQGFEHVPYTDLPYDLVAGNLKHYGQIGSKDVIFPIYGAYGCPYQCTFCISPKLYRHFGKKWVPLGADEIAEHIGHVSRRYGATGIYFYDDDSFVDLNHVASIIDEVKKRGIAVKMSFRGARVNEVLKMDEQYLKALSDAGTHMLHIGMESGSKRIRDLRRKNISVENVLEVNRKLARVDTIIAAYNWIVGTPTETMEDMAQSRALILRLVEENQRAIIFQPNKFEPLPGTELFELALKHGYKEPATLEEWVIEEREGDRPQPWYSPDMDREIKMLQVASYFIDRKSELLLERKSFRNSLIKLMISLYRPLARYRFRKGCSAFLLEYPVFQCAASHFRK